MQKSSWQCGGFTNAATGLCTWHPGLINPVSGSAYNHLTVTGQAKALSKEKRIKTFTGR